MKKNEPLKEIIRIHIIEDDLEVILPGLKSMFRANRDMIDFAGASPTVEHAVNTVNPESVDIFFLDLYIPDTVPEVNIKLLKVTFPHIPIIIYSTEESSIWKRKAYLAGAKGYVTKKYGKKQIKQIIYEIASGGTAFYGLPDIHQDVLLQNVLKNQDVSLTTIEKEIILRLCKGMRIKETAKSLSISSSTVEKSLLVLRQRYKAITNLQLIQILKDCNKI
jgi:two-component system, NarL family, response regulator, fimbrial Z protein, FimZ